MKILELDDDIAAAIELLIEVLENKRQREFKILFESNENINYNSKKHPMKKGSQLERLLKFSIENGTWPKAVFPNQVKAFLESQNESPSSISQMTHLKQFGVYSNGKKKGWSYRPKTN